MTGNQFRKLHGDPAKWTDNEYELIAECATPGDPQPALELLARLKAQTTTDLTPAAQPRKDTNPMLATLRAHRRNRLIANTTRTLARAADLNENPNHRTINADQVIAHAWTNHLLTVTPDEAQPHVDEAITHWRLQPTPTA